MMFHLHYLAQTGIINIVKLAVLKTILPIDGPLHWKQVASTVGLGTIGIAFPEYRQGIIGIRISVCVRGFIQAPGQPSMALPG